MATEGNRLVLSLDSDLTLTWLWSSAASLPHNVPERYHSECIYYSGIIPGNFHCLLYPKLFWNNPPRPRANPQREALSLPHHVSEGTGPSGGGFVIQFHARMM